MPIEFNIRIEEGEDDKVYASMNSPHSSRYTDGELKYATALRDTLSKFLHSMADEQKIKVKGKGR